MADKITIITNRHAYDLVTWQDLPAKAKADFDYLDEDDKFSTRFVRYKGWWYDVNEFMPVPKELGDWNGYHSDSFYSGILVRYVPDTHYEQVQMATFFA